MKSVNLVANRVCSAAQVGLYYNCDVGVIVLITMYQIRKVKLFGSDPQAVYKVMTVKINSRILFDALSPACVAERQMATSRFIGLLQRCGPSVG